MSRYKQTSEGMVSFTAEEEAEWDAKEAAWAAQQAQTPPAPTKEELLAQLNAIAAQIQALE